MMQAADARGPGVLVVIPASLASARLPGKMLLEESGRPLILHTCERAARARRVAGIVVATDSPEIRRIVEGAGVPVALTPSDVATGTDRVAAVAADRREPFFINLQGDEPEIAPDDIDRVADALVEGDGAAVVTMAQRIRDPREWRDPNTVKVVADREGRALYFSRAPIPHSKGGERGGGGGGAAPCELGWKHVGIYGFPRERLLEFARLPRGFLERREGLEQLRAMEHGWPVRVLESPGDTHGIDSAEDYARFVAALGASEAVEEAERA